MIRCYYVYTDTQLEEAVETFAQRHVQEGKASAKDAETLKRAVRALHESPEFGERGMRRGGEGGAG